MKKILVFILICLSISLFAEDIQVKETKESLYKEAFDLYNKFDSKSQKEAYEKFSKSADMGYIPSLMRVGLCLLYNKGVSSYYEKAIKTIDEAFPQLKELAEKDSNAAYEYGMALLTGIGTKPHAYIGYKYILQSSKDIPYANLQVGFCLVRGYGCEKSVPEALNYYQKAKELGIKEADYHLGHFYLNAIGPLKNMKKGIALLEEADKNNILDATNYLGTMYLNGNGFKKDNDKAFLYFKKAADGEHPRAMYNLGMCYYEGVGCQVNEEKAVELILKAAVAGDDKACDMLAQENHKKQLSVK